MFTPGQSHYPSIGHQPANTELEKLPTAIWLLRQPTGQLQVIGAEQNPPAVPSTNAQHPAILLFSLS